jgi:23S rRNA (cytidine1920-2'-O)/16S rRNA (cytidine1409-2'-O)-methyltransferase
VQARILACALTTGFTVLDYFESPIKGGDGNREFFIFARAA